MEITGPTADEVFARMDLEKKVGICWILQYPQYVPWFRRSIESWADSFRMTPRPSEIATRMKWIMLDKGLAATGYLVNGCKMNKGTFTSPVRTYRLPTPEESTGAMKQAIAELGWPQEWV